MTERPCGKDCPRRKPGCQNEETCEKWKEHMIRVRADLAEFRRGHAVRGRGVPLHGREIHVAGSDRMRREPRKRAILLVSGQRERHQRSILEAEAAYAEEARGGNMRGGVTLCVTPTARAARILGIPTAERAATICTSPVGVDRALPARAAPYVRGKKQNGGAARRRGGRNPRRRGGGNTKGWIRAGRGNCTKRDRATEGSQKRWGCTRIRCADGEREAHLCVSGTGGAMKKGEMI